MLVLDLARKGWLKVLHGDEEMTLHVKVSHGRIRVAINAPRSFDVIRSEAIKPRPSGSEPAG